MLNKNVLTNKYAMFCITTDTILHKVSKWYHKNDHYDRFINTIITLSLYDANIVVGVETVDFHTSQETKTQLMFIFCKVAVDVSPFRAVSVDAPERQQMFLAGIVVWPQESIVVPFMYTSSLHCCKMSGKHIPRIVQFFNRRTLPLKKSSNTVHDF